MKVRDFLQIATKDKEASEYDARVIIKKNTRTGFVTLADSKACELLNVDNIDGKVYGLQEYTIVTMDREIGDEIPIYNCPYVLWVL